MKKVIECQLSAQRITTGSSPFTKDKWIGVLKIDSWLDEPFAPGDTVRVTVERIKERK